MTIIIKKTQMEERQGDGAAAERLLFPVLICGTNYQKKSPL